MYSFILKNVLLIYIYVCVCVEYTCMEYYSTTKNEILPSAIKRMDLDGIMLDEIRQTEIKILYIFYYMWNLKNKTNIPIQKKRN